MKIELTEQGYWLASGRWGSRLILAEGTTREEARRRWIDCVVDRGL